MIGGAVCGIVGSVVANGGRMNNPMMVGSAASGAGGAILARGLGGDRLLAVIGAGLGSAGGACLAKQNTAVSHVHSSRRNLHTKHIVATKGATQHAQAI